MADPSDTARPIIPHVRTHRDWSRLTTQTTLWSAVEIDDFWGLWQWSTVRAECAFGGVAAVVTVVTPGRHTYTYGPPKTSSSAHPPSTTPMTYLDR